MRDPLNKHWLRKWLRFEPHFVIGEPENPYLLRWYVIPRNRHMNIYLHKFMRSDDDRALHDHPWPFMSLVLKGGYWEHREGKLVTAKSWRSPGSIAFRKPDTLHRVELEQDYGRWRFDPDGGYEKPCWTLFFTGPKVREWGFRCEPPIGWRHWEEFDVKGCAQ